MKIKVLSLNCWIFPCSFSIKNKDRLESLIRLIRKNDPHIITLQEMWSNKYINYLKENLTDYHFSYKNSKIINKTGLITITKNKPLSFKNNIFPTTKEHNITELFLKKGYSKTIIKINKSKLKIINTHLYAPISKSTSTIPECQFKIILKDINNNSLVCGDFNLNHHHIKKLITDKNIDILTNRNITRSKKNIYTQKRFNKLFSNKNVDIDHILAKIKGVKSRTKIIKKPLFSDHYAILSEVQI